MVAELVLDLAVVVMRDRLASWQPPQRLAILNMLGAQNTGVGDNVQRRSAETKLRCHRLHHNFYFIIIVLCDVGVRKWCSFT